VPHTTTQVLKLLNVTAVTLNRHREKLGIPGKKKGREVYFSDSQVARLKKSLTANKTGWPAGKRRGPSPRVFDLKAAVQSVNQVVDRTCTRVANLERILKDHGLWEEMTPDEMDEVLLDGELEEVDARATRPDTRTLDHPAHRGPGERLT
jgi:hypothetical protein